METFESFEAMWRTQAERRRRDDGDEAKPFQHE